MKKLSLIMFAIVILLASCSEDSNEIAERADREIREYLALRNLEAERTDDGLFYIIHEPGSEEKPTLNSELTVHYQGKFINGRIFDSSYGRQPATFMMTGVIQGWQKGIPLIGKGGRVTLLVPPQLGYGDTPPPGIPANSVLIFDVELIDFK